MTPMLKPVRLICNDCGLRAWGDGDANLVCEDCGGELRRMGRLEGFFDRWFAPPDQEVSELHHRHTQMIELLWTRENRAQELYRVLQPRGISFSGFVSRITDVVCRGIDEGWVQVTIPRAPVPNDSAYDLVFLDPDRFADEVNKLFPPR